MRTTLELQDDVYLHARAVADAERVPVGQVVSRWMRQALNAQAAPAAESTVAPSGRTERLVHGIPVIEADDRLITMGLIERIREEEGV